MRSYVHFKGRHRGSRCRVRQTARRAGHPNETAALSENVPTNTAERRWANASDADGGHERHVVTKRRAQKG